MRTLFVALVTILLSGIASADGIGMTKDNRFSFKRETCYTLALTKAQVAELDRTMKEAKQWDVHEIALTKKQTRFLKKKTGKTVTRLNVFENGWHDCSCGAQNIASRFAPDQVEVSNVYLRDQDPLQDAKKEKKVEARQEASEVK